MLPPTPDMVVSPSGASATMVQSLCLQLSHCRALFLVPTYLPHVPTPPAANAHQNRGAGRSIALGHLGCINLARNHAFGIDLARNHGCGR